MRKVAVILLLSIVSFPAFSWVEGVGVTIDEVMMWEGADTANTHFKLSTGKWCYIPGAQKNLNALVLAVHVAGKKVNIHCHDTADQSGGGSVTPAHRLHRIIAIKN